MIRMSNVGKIPLFIVMAASFLMPLRGENSRTGKVVAEWDFTKGSPDGTDSSGKKIGMTANPSNLTTADVLPELAPKAFRLTVVFQMPAKLSWNNYLWENHTQKNGMGLILHRAWSPEFHIPVLVLGNESGGSDLIMGKRRRLKPGKIYTLTCEYDGNDKVVFSWDGIAEKTVMTSVCGKTGPAKRKTVIHCRNFPSNPQQPTFVRKVRLESLPGPDVILSAAYRCAFVHNEQNAKLKMFVANDSGKSLNDCRLFFSGKDSILSGEKRISGMKKGARMNVLQDVSTKLSVGSYPCRVQFEATDETGKKYSRSYDFTLRIAPIQHPAQGQGVYLGGSDYSTLPKNMGLNFISYAMNFTNGAVPKRFNNGWQRPFFQLVDDILCDGHSFGDQSIASSLGTNMWRKFPRYTVSGKPYPCRNPDAMNPDFLAICEDYTKTFAEIIKDYSPWTIFYTSSEVRDSAEPSFTKLYRDSYRKYASAEIPQMATGKSLPYQQISHFPATRIIPDDYPLLKYYRWYWKYGDGWNHYQDRIAETLKSVLGNKVTTSFAPAVRVPPIWGSGGHVSTIRHWYYPIEPFHVTYLASELLAMAKGNPGQNIALSLQGILYGRAAPTNKKVSNPPDWVKRFTKQPRYITTPPDLMTEGLWSAFARKCENVDFYAIRSLVDYYDGSDNPYDGYKYTNPETIKAIGKIYREVGKPFAPVFRLIPERKPEVAVLESYASSIFANRGTWGWEWTGWIWDCASILNLANLQPAAIYEEEIARDGFGSIKVLFMPHCDVLTETTYRKICEFQKNGGIVIGDKFLPPGILPDFNLAVFTPVKQPDKDKVEMQKRAAALLKKLAPYYRPYAGSDNADLRLWIRTSGKNDDWLFVINDKRTFGDYIGQYGIVMEKGLPNAGTVSVRRKAGIVYDLLAHKEVPFVSKNGITRIRTEFKTNDGRLYLLRDQPFEKMTLRIPDKTARGEKIDFAVQIRNAALVPLQISVTDPAGNRTDDSCYAALENGNYKQSVTVPLNVRPGIWMIQVRNLANGQTVSGKFSVETKAR